MSVKAPDQAVDRSRERIARAAIEVAARARRGKLSVVDICEEAGVSRGTFYRHFSGSLDVQSAMAPALANAVILDLENGLQAHRSVTLDPVRRLADVLSRAFVADTFIGDLFRSRPVLALELTAAAANDIAQAVVTWLAPDAVGRRRRDQIDDVAALVRLAAATGLAPQPDDAQLLHRAAGAWLAGAGEPNGATAQAS